MIINHSKKFIFIKTPKTGGSSVEFYLSQYCKEKDTITPLLKDEEFDITQVPNTFINPTESFSDMLVDYEMKNNTSVWEHNKRSVWNDTQNFWQGGYHPNLFGYKLIGNYVYSQLKNKINAQAK